MNLNHCSFVSDMIIKSGIETSGKLDLLQINPQSKK